MILVIDDKRTFNFPAIYARNVATAKLLLGDKEEWDEVWFDHDLGDALDGMEVVRFLEERIADDKPVRIGKVVVHSQNPVGAAAIALALEKHYTVVRQPITTGPAPWKVKE